MALRQLDAVRGPVCGVFAAALVRPSDLPFQVTFNTAALVLKRKSHWKGRMKNDELRYLLGVLGVDSKECYGFDRMTLRKAAEQLDPSARYVISVTGHFLVLSYGQAYDQSNPSGRSISDYKWRNSRIKFVMKISQS